MPSFSHERLLIVAAILSGVIITVTPVWGITTATQNKQAYQKMSAYVCGARSLRILKTAACPLLKPYQKTPTTYNESAFIKSVCTKNKTACQTMNKNKLYTKATQPYLSPVKPIVSKVVNPLPFEKINTPSIETSDTPVSSDQAGEAFFPSYPSDAFSGSGEQPSMGFQDPTKERYVIPFVDYSEENLAGFSVIINNQTPNKTAVLSGLSQTLTQLLAGIPKQRQSFVKTVRWVVGPGSDCNVASLGAMYEVEHNLVRVCASESFTNNSPYAFHLVVHEVAHAYHFKKLGQSNTSVSNAFSNAIMNQLYAEGETGLSFEKGAYASYSPLEYFAELTSMYFGTIEYSPKNKAELKAYDPKGYAMVEKLWNTPEEDFSAPEYNFNTIEF